jgi:hypothetical protein
MTVDSVLDEMIEGDRQLSIVVAAVVRQLDFDAGESTMSTEAQWGDSSIRIGRGANCSLSRFRRR